MHDKSIESDFNRRFNSANEDQSTREACDARQKQIDDMEPFYSDQVEKGLCVICEDEPTENAACCKTCREDSDVYYDDIEKKWFHSDVVKELA